MTLKYHSFNNLKNTLGRNPAGLAVDKELRVLNTSGNIIPSLYAGGEILGFGRTSGNAFVGGVSLTPTLTFGKLLGERLPR